MYLVIFNKKSFRVIFLYFNLFLMKLKIKLEFQFESYAVIMLVNIFVILLTLLWNLMLFFSKLYVLIHLNRMGWSSARINILLKLLHSFNSWWGSSTVFGWCYS